jgi:hypothetical protein
MTESEFQRWVEFYTLYPFDDEHRHHRPAALIASRIGGQEVQTMLDWLAPDPATKEMSDADIRTMRALGFVRPQGD